MIFLKTKFSSVIICLFLFLNKSRENNFSVLTWLLVELEMDSRILANFTTIKIKKRKPDNFS